MRLPISSISSRSRASYVPAVSMAIGIIIIIIIIIVAIIVIIIIIIIIIVIIIKRGSVLQCREKKKD